MKKLTYEFVKAGVEAEGYELLSTQYKGNKEKLAVKCDKGHVYTVSWNDFQQGSTCLECYNENQRFTLEYVKKKIEEVIGYKLISTEYINQRAKLKIRCDKGHLYKAAWRSFRGGDRCPECVDENRRHSIEYIRTEVAKRGYTLISKEYVNAHTEIKVRCEEGHTFSTTWHKVQGGGKCPECIEHSTTKKTIEEVREYIKKEGYTLLSDGYVNNKTKLKMRCPDGHEFPMGWGSFLSGQRCPEDGGTRKKTIEEVREYVDNSTDYKLLSNEYVNSSAYLLFKCEKGHEFPMSWNNFKSGHECPKCTAQVSKAEQEIFDLIKPHCPDAIQSDRTIIGPLELDIVIPSRKLAIEYCGLYWHSEAQGKDKNYHLEKLEKCNEAGYDLVTIFEDEWLSKQEIVISRILYKIGASPAKRIHARKCKIKEIEPKIKNEFLNKHHIQGGDNSRVKLGAFYEDELVAVMTMSRPSLAKGGTKGSNVWELNRFCSSMDYLIPGIASKLFKHFTRNWEFSEIKTFGDRRWSTGHVYSMLNFKFKHASQPNYWYLLENNTVRKHRFNYRKNVLKDKLEIFNPERTEVQNMNDNGMTRIFDCGNVVWVFSK